MRDIYLSDFSLNLKDQVVRHLTDNKAVETIMRIGLSVPKLQQMVVDIFKKCRELNLTLLVEWRSRDVVTALELPKTCDFWKKLNLVIVDLLYFDG